MEVKVWYESCVGLLARIAHSLLRTNDSVGGRAMNKSYIREQKVSVEGT